MKPFLFLCAALALSTSSAWASPQYMCGAGNRATRQIYKYHSPVLATAQKAAARGCRANTNNPAVCTAPYCVAYEDGYQPAPRPTGSGGWSGPTQSEIDAVRATEEAKRQQREDEINRLLKEREEWQRKHGH